MNIPRDRAGPVRSRRVFLPAFARWARACLPLVAASGCAGDARVELAAADSIEAVAAAVETAVAEYHAETESADDARESAVIAAFVQRMAAAGDDAAERERHAGEFTAAMGRVRADRRVEWSRFTASQENLETLHEITAGLRRLALESLTLSDEARRYLMSLVEAASRASAESRSQTAAVPGKEVSNVGSNR